MNLSEQVTNLELSEKLKSLNVKQESLFYYLNMYDGSHHILYIDKLSHTKDHYISCYTASELLEFYPKFINDWIFRIEKYPSEFEVKYCDRNDEKRLCVEFDKNLCNALAKMLIHLIENKIIEV